MSQAFSQSLRSIENDNPGPIRWIGWVGAGLLVAWGAFMGWAKVPVVVTSVEARLVKARAVHPIQAELSGTVAKVFVGLEDRVEEGDPLLELNSSRERLALQEVEARAAALSGEIRAANRHITALRAVDEKVEEADRARLEQAQLAHQSSELAFTLAEDEARRIGELAKQGGVSEIALLQANSARDQARLAQDASGVQLVRLPAEASSATAERASVLADAQQDLAVKQGELQVIQARIEALEYELSKRTLRAAAGGKVAELASLTQGSVVAGGQTLGAIVATAGLVVEADFDPADALGRVRVGHIAELVLDGFPRPQYGALDLSVERVSSEPRDGLIRVELAVDQEVVTRLPLEHGLPGSLRVETERVSPLELVLRTVSRRWAQDDTPRDV